MPTIDVNGTQLFYVEEGPRDAPAMVMSHSLFFDHRMFDELAAAFSERFRVVRYDHRGQGQSAPTDMASVDQETLTDDAAALLEAIGAVPCIFLGNSMGGFIALRLAARRPDLLRGAVVLGSSAEHEHKLADFAPLVEALGEHGTAPVIDALMHIMFGDTIVADPTRAELVGHWKEKMLGLGPDIARSAHGVIHRKSVLDELAGATVPILVLAGAEDHAYPVPLSENIAKAAPQADMHVVPGAGHSVALEAPQFVREQIDGFVARLER